MESLVRFTQLASNFPALLIFAAQGGSQWDLLGIGREGLTAVGIPQTERSLTILHIKKLGREIEEFHAVAATGRGGENMGKPENGPAALQSMDNDVRPLTPSRSPPRVKPAEGHSALKQHFMLK